MNVLFVTDDLREADFLKNELEKSVPSFRLDISPTISAAAGKISNSAQFDVVLLDTSISVGDKAALAAEIRKDKRSAALIALIRESDAPSSDDLLKSGINNVVLKRSGYIHLLTDLFQNSRSNNGSDGNRGRRLRLLYAGDIENARRFLSGIPQLTLEPADFAPDGSLQLPDNNASPDLIALDFSVTGPSTLRSIKNTSQRAPEIPIILLTDPGNEEIGIQAIRSGAADSISKTGNYFLRLLLSIQKEISRRETIREKSALKSREDRLRHIVESMPVGVTIVAQDGTVMAINQAGLRIMGAERLDQIVGRTFTELLTPEDGDRIQTFFSGVCGGTSAAVQVALPKPDGKQSVLELRGVPMRRDNNGTVAALIVIDYANPGISSEQPNRLEEFVKIRDEYETAIRELKSRIEQQDVRWATALKQSEAQRLSAEELNSQLKNEYSATQAGYQALLEERQAEQSAWEQERNQYREDIDRRKKEAEALRSAHSALVAAQAEKEAGWESRHRELEHELAAGEEQARSLQSRIQTAESGLAQALEEHNTERTRRDLAQKELEERCGAAEKEAAAFLEKLQIAELGAAQIAKELSESREELRAAAEERLALAATVESQGAELSMRDAAQKELEDRCRVLEEEVALLRTGMQNAELGSAQLNEEYRRVLLLQTDLQEKLLGSEEQVKGLQSQIAQMAEAHGAELSRYQVIQQELEQRCQAADEQAAALRTALQQAESDAARMIAAHNEELAQYQTIQRDLEQKSSTAEQEAAALRTALQNAEAGSAYMAEAHGAELSRYQIIQQELEQKCQAADEQAAALRTELQQAESNAARMIATHNEELAQYQTIQRDLEQKSSTAEQEAAALRTALQNAEAGSAYMAEAHGAELSRYQIIQQELEQKCQAADEQAAALRTELQQAESDAARMIAAHNEELAQYQTIQRELEERCGTVEQEAAALRTALQDAEARSAQMAEAHGAELSRYQIIQQELEQKCQAADEQAAALRTELQQAESDAARMIAAHNEELAQYQTIQRELEERCGTAEQEAAALRTALQDAEARSAQMAEAHGAELSRYQIIQQELEQKCQAADEQAAALRVALQQAESDAARMIADHNEELAQYQTIQRELEEKCGTVEQEAAALRTALQDAEARSAQMAEAHGAELSRYQIIQQEIEQKCQAADEQAAALRTELLQAESDAARMIAAHNEELAQYQTIQRELEQKCGTAEQEAAALRTALQDAEARSAQMAEAHGAELSRYQIIQQELEQKCQAADEQASALRAALQQAESDAARMIAAHNEELSTHQLTRRELENRCSSAEEQITALKNVLQNVELAAAQMAEAHQAELSRSQAAVREFEEKFRVAQQQSLALEAALKNLEVNSAEMLQIQTAEYSRCKATIDHLEEECRNQEASLASLEASLNHATSELQSFIERHATELSQRDLLLKDLEGKCGALQAVANEKEAQAARLSETCRVLQAECEEKCRIAQEKRHEAETRLTSVMKDHEAESARWSLELQEWERKLKTAEDDHTSALQSVAGEAESRLSRMAQECRIAGEQLASARQELEQINAASLELGMRYQRLSQFVTAAVLTATPDGVVTECNEAAARMFGYSNPAEALANGFRIYAFEGALRARLFCEKKIENVEWSSLDRHGRPIRVQERATLLDTQSENGVMVERILTDVSRIHTLSEEIRRLQKRQSAGDLAYATVRSLKELCSSMVRSGEILLETQDGDALRRLAENVLHDANRGIKHARQFLSLSKKVDRLPALLDLNEVLTANDTLLQNLAGEDIDLHASLAERIGFISADRQELIQLLSGIVASSREALPLGGTLSIETSNVEIDSPQYEDPAELRPGIYVLLTVAADGCTVYPERRTGSIRASVERMGASLELIQTPQSGNIFRIYWQRVETFAGECPAKYSEVV